MAVKVGVVTQDVKDTDTGDIQWHAVHTESQKWASYISCLTLIPVTESGYRQTDRHTLVAR
jgi:hypothetical protein